MGVANPHTTPITPVCCHTVVANTCAFNLNKCVVFLLFTDKANPNFIPMGYIISM